MRRFRNKRSPREHITTNETLFPQSNKTFVKVQEAEDRPSSSAAGLGSSSSGDAPDSTE
jgi:hypothetical protein